MERAVGKFGDLVVNGDTINWLDFGDDLPEIMGSVPPTFNFFPARSTNTSEYYAKTDFGLLVSAKRGRQIRKRKIAVTRERT